MPDPSWSSIEKAFYCRAQAINLLEEAERAEYPAQAEELAGIALRWLALARFHEAESTRALLNEDRSRANGGAYSGRAQPRELISRPRRDDVARFDRRR